MVQALESSELHDLEKAKDIEHEIKRLKHGHVDLGGRTHKHALGWRHSEGTFSERALAHVVHFVKKLGAPLANHLSISLNIGDGEPAQSRQVRHHSRGRFSRLGEDQEGGEHRGRIQRQGGERQGRIKRGGFSPA